MSLFSNYSLGDSIALLAPGFLAYGTILATPLALLFFFIDHRLSRRCVITGTIACISLALGVAISSSSYITAFTFLLVPTAPPLIIIDFAIICMFIAAVFAGIDKSLSQRVRLMYGIGVTVFILNMLVPYNLLM